MRASDLHEIRKHIEEAHSCEISMESMGIEQLPTITKRRKQNFSGLVIDEYGMIDTDGLDVDDDFAPNDNEHLLLEDSDDKETVVEETVSRPLTRKRKPIHNVVSPPTKRKKVDSKKSNNSTLSCDICMSTFSRKDNLLRHVKNKH